MWFALVLAVASELAPTDLTCRSGCANTRAPFPVLTNPAPAAWAPLPLGSIAPGGWLLEQLLVQANALSGFMPRSTFPGADTVNQSLWVGGDAPTGRGTDQWLPYWSNGNVPLVMLLRAAGPAALARLDPAADLPRVVDEMMEYVLSHTNKSSGWIGPMLNEPGDANGHGLWDPLNMLRSLLAYAEATPASRRRVATAVVAHLTAESELLKTDPVYKWASTRWPTFVQICLDVIDRLVPSFGADRSVMPLGGKATTELLMNASRLFRSKGMDWHAYYARTGPVKFPYGSVDNWNTNDHGVNNAEGALAWPAMDHRLGGGAAGAHAEMDLALRMLDTYQAQPNALFCADEVFCGRAPHRGTETCAVVESMASLEQAFAVLGTPDLMDRAEALAFNALPAALTGDMWTHVYVSRGGRFPAGRAGAWPTTAYDGGARLGRYSRPTPSLRATPGPRFPRRSTRPAATTGCTTATRRPPAPTPTAPGLPMATQRHAPRPPRPAVAAAVAGGGWTRRPVRTRQPTSTASRTSRAASPTSLRAGPSSRPRL